MPSRRPPPSPTEAALILRLDQVDYRLIRVGRDWLLRKPDGTTYAIARTRSGLTCDCPRSRFAVAAETPCKHVVALGALGIHG